ncbi:50S ribosomal protein L24e [Halolamina sp. C58]|uniref:50S ribosomal protein L24e n=1 Tax=Halolamina sp. C58 TaxID=3421640 RepID=UPI003EC0BF18
MPQNRTCDYCGDDVEPGTGTMFVHTNGSVVHYCSAKCEKNADLGREPRDLEWTEEGGDHGVEAEAAAEEEEEEEATEEAEAAESETEEVEEDAEEAAEADADEDAESESEEAADDEESAADDEEDEE